MTRHITPGLGRVNVLVRCVRQQDPLSFRNPARPGTTLSAGWDSASAVPNGCRSQRPAYPVPPSYTPTIARPQCVRKGRGNGRVVRSSHPPTAPPPRDETTPPLGSAASHPSGFSCRDPRAPEPSPGEHGHPCPVPVGGVQSYPWPGISASSETSRVPPIPRKGQALAMARAACMESA